MRPLAAAGAAGALVLGLLGLLLPGASGGWSAKITNSTDTVGSAPYFTCATAYAADKGSALFQLPLTETSGTSAADVSGNGRNGTYQGALGSTASPGACSRDGGTAYTLDGKSSYISTSTKQTNPTTFSIEVWFKTTVAGGRLAGFDSNQTGAAGQYDRQLYVTTAGLLTFGVYNNGYVTVSSTTAVNDGAWHHAVATFAPSGTANPGETLYLDGQQVAVATSSTTAQNTTGWWRFGFDGPGSWPNSGSSGYFTGQLRYAAIYTAALTPKQVQNHWAAGR